MVKKALWVLPCIAAVLVLGWLAQDRGPDGGRETAPGGPGAALGPSLEPLSKKQGGKPGGVLMAMGADSVWIGPDQGKEPPPGPWGPRQEAMDKLGNLGYLAGYRSPPPASGVLVYDPERAMPGVNLCLSAHKASAVLLSMDGKILHEWSYRHEDLPEELRAKDFVDSLVGTFFRYARVLPNGDLLAIYDYRGLIKLDRFSRPLWYRPNGANHDFIVQADGSIILLGCRYRLEPRWNASQYIVEDQILFLDPDGIEKRSISIAECFENSPFSAVLRERAREGGDLFHANKIEVLDGAWEAEDPAFAKGNILVSLREVSALAVVDVEKESIAWLKIGGWRFQHESQILPDGHLILLDNLGYHGNSRVMEIDPFSEKVYWEYHGDPPESFRTLLAGGLQRLENGNTLVTDTVAGRAFELGAGDDKVVWEYVNPHRVRKSSLAPPKEPGPDPWFIAALFRVARLAQDFPLDWIPGDEDGDGAM